MVMLRDDVAVAIVPPPPSDETPARLPRRGLVLLVVGVAAARWLFAADRRIFHIVPDESAQLAMARYLGGGTRWNMFDHIGYRPGYATLIAPLAWLTDEPTAWFRSVIVLNAVLGGVGAALLAVLARRWTTLSGVGCLLLAGAASSLPTGMVASAHVWAESLVTVTFLLTLVLLLWLSDRPTVPLALVATLVGVLAFTSHNRLLPLALTTVLLATVLLARRHGWVRSALIVLPWGLVLLAASVAYKRFLTARVWETPAAGNSAVRALARLWRVGDITGSVIGQSWYELATTAGVAGIGLIVLVRSLRRPWGLGLPTRLRASDAALVAALVVPSIGLSMVFMAGRDRVDQLVYGRYVDGVAGPLLVLGGGWLAGSVARRQRIATVSAVAGAMVVFAVVLQLAHGGRFADDIGLRPMIPGVLAANGSGSALRLLPVTVAGVVALVALAAGCRPRPSATRFLTGVAAILVVLGVGAVRTHDALDSRLNGWMRIETLTELPATTLPPGSLVEVRFVPDAISPDPDWVEQHQIAQAMQFHRPDLRFATGAPGASYVATALDDEALLATGATVIWSDEKTGFALYRLPP